MTELCLLGLTFIADLLRFLVLWFRSEGSLAAENLLMCYIRHYNRAPKPIKWTYRDLSQRITFNTNVTVTGR